MNAWWVSVLFSWVANLGYRRNIIVHMSLIDHHFCRSSYEQLTLLPELWASAGRNVVQRYLLPSLWHNWWVFVGILLGCGLLHSKGSESKIRLNTQSRYSWFSLTLERTLSKRILHFTLWKMKLAFDWRMTKASLCPTFALFFSSQSNVRAFQNQGCHLRITAQALMWIPGRKQLKKCIKNFRLILTYDEICYSQKERSCVFSRKLLSWDSSSLNSSSLQTKSRQAGT